MKRGVFDLLRRGLDNTVANWQVMVIRFVEAFVFVLLAIGAAIVIVAPILISVGIHVMDLKTPEDLESAFDALMTQWMLLGWIVLGIFVLVLIFMLIHSFVEAGCARVYVDGDRVAGPQVLGPRARYRVFSLDRFMAGGKEGWWTVFWIYNLVWLFASLILLIPLVPTAVLMLVFRDQTAALVITGCAGLGLTFLLMVVVAVVTGMCCNRAIVAWAVHRTSVRESTSVAWQAIKSDLARHLLITLAMIVVGIAGSMFISSLTMFAGFGEAVSRSHAVMFITLPLRFFGSLLNSAFSAAIGCWYIASYAALALDPYQR